VREWLQIWIQDLEEFIAIGSGFEDQVSSDQLDRRWHQYWRAVKDTAGFAVVLEVPENQLRPLYLDAQKWRIVSPLAPQGTSWILCRDDKSLGAAGLPKYSESTWRYLTTTGSRPDPQCFVAVDRNAPVKAGVTSKSADLGFNPAWLPVSPQGGQLSARVHPPLGFEDYVDLLNGATLGQIGSRKSECEAAILRSTLAIEDQDGRRHGLLLSDNNAVELFYLKLRLFLEASRTLFIYLRELQCPLLNLDPASFGIFPGANAKLPWPWTTTCELTRPGRAIPFAVPYTSEVRFVSSGNSGATAYCPIGFSRRRTLVVAVRVLHVNIEDEQKASLEGTIWTSSPEPVGASDFLRLRIPEDVFAGDFFGTAVTDGGAKGMEFQFRTWPRALSPEEIVKLKGLEGGRLERCWCELIPALSSPYDLYSLSVLGARTLLSHDKNPLPLVVDEVERLGRAASVDLPKQASLQETAAVVERLFANDFAGTCLSPCHLRGQLFESSQSSDIVPSRLWAEVVAILVRLTPGLGPVSQCSDFGSAPTGGLHLPLEEPLAALESLCARARSLIFSDWNMNREVRSLLSELQQIS
jgi:hypothetical protein